jgi:HK97 family phage major capsid protein
MDKIQEALEAVKDTLEQKSKAMEQKISETNAEYDSRLARQQEEMVDLQQKLHNIEAASQRPNSQVNESDELEKEYRTKFANFLRHDSKHELEQLQTKLLNTVSDPDGGFTVPKAMADTIITRVFETSPMRSLATVMTIGTKSIEIPIDDGEFSCMWAHELDTYQNTNNSQFGKLEIPVFDLYAMPSATNSMIEDSALNLEAWISGKVADKFSRVQNTSFVSGTGVGQPSGFLTKANYTVAGAYERGKIEQITSGSSGVITADSMISLQTSLKEPYQANAVFALKRSSFANVRKLKDTTNQYLLGMGINSSNTQEMQICGKPVVFMDDMPAVGADALAVAYGDFRQGYAIVDRLGITTIRDIYSSKGRVVWNVRTRVGGDVLNGEAIKLLKLA